MAAAATVPDYETSSARDPGFRRSPRPSTTIVYVAAFVVTGMVTTVLGPILPELLESLASHGCRRRRALHRAVLRQPERRRALGLLVSRLGDAPDAGARLRHDVRRAAGDCRRHLRVGVAGAFAAGVGMGCVIPPTNLLVARGRRERAASALGGLNFAWGIGAALWPLIVSLAVRFWRDTPARSSTLALLCAVVAARIAGRAGARDGDGRGDAPMPRIDAGRAGGALRRADLLYSGTEMALGGWLPELARRLPGAGSSARVGSGRRRILGRAQRRPGADRRQAGSPLRRCVRLRRSRADVVRHRRPAAARPRDRRGRAVAAALSGLGLGPVFPVTAAALSREMPIRLAGPLLALGSLGGATLPWMVGIISDTSQSLRGGVRLADRGGGPAGRLARAQKGHRPSDRHDRACRPDPLTVLTFRQTVSAR